MARWLLAWMMLCLVPAVGAAPPAADFDEGIEYQRIVPAQPTEDPAKVEVVEMFWYGCPHCYRFEPFVERWLAKAPKHVRFMRVAAPLNPSWVVHARAYYAAEALGVIDRIHKPLLDAIHKERRRLNTEDALAAFFTEHGVDERDFRRAFHSFAVETKVRRARDLARRYGVNSVPAVVINGKYRTDGTLAGGYERLLQVIDFLVAKEWAEIRRAAR